jgi:hypothetical protein
MLPAASCLEYWLEHNIANASIRILIIITMNCDHASSSWRMMLCWHCENRLREQTTDTLTGWRAETLSTGLLILRC